MFYLSLYQPVPGLLKFDLPRWSTWQLGILKFRGPLGLVFSMWPTKFCYLKSLIHINLSNTDLICLAFVVNGGKCQHN